MTTSVVSAAIVERGGRFLITRRQKGVHLEGYWEFPGGKCDAGETIDACLVRELREELGVTAQIADEVFTITHAYTDRVVELHFLRCTIDGDPQPLLGQEVRWATREELSELTFPPADAELIQRLQGRSG